MNTPSLQDRVAIITGAAGDIGMAMAARFLAAGARLALMDRDGALLHQRAAALGAGEDRVVTMECDVADEHQSRAKVDEVAACFGALHVLVNNAATVTDKHAIASLPVADWHRTLAVNLTGPFLMAKWAIPHLKAAGGGVVLNIASQLGHVTAPGRGAYGATKAALHSLTRSIAVDHAADGIRAVSLSPGSVMTSRLTTRYGSEDAVNRELAGRHPIGRIGTPQEVAEAALFLVSDAASFITGTDLLADGGYTAI